MTIFFVFHAVYLIRISIYNHRRNRGYFAKSIKSLVQQIEEVEKKPWWSPSKLLYHFDFFSLSTLREKAEFKVVQTIFQALYLVPRNFNYPAYISGCYERYALKTINRSLVSWFILLMAILINYLRLFIGYKCSIHSFSAGAHRLLGATSGATTVDADATHEIERENDACRKLTMREFLVVGAMITVYNLGVLIASRVYKWRLVRFSGIKNSKDLLGYLQYFDTFEEDFKREIKATKRFSAKQLLSEIETTLNETEHDEEEETIRLLASVVTTVISKLRNIITEIRFGFRLLLVSIFCPNRRKQKLLKRNSSLLMSGGLSQSKKGQKLARTSSGVEMNYITEETTSPAENKSQKATAGKGLHKGNNLLEHSYEEPSLKEVSTKKNKSGIIASLRAFFSVTSSNHLGNSETASLFRQKSSMLAMMREQRPMLTMQQRISVNMNGDLPSHHHESQDMLFQDVGDATVLSVDRIDQMVILPSDEKHSEENVEHISHIKDNVHHLHHHNDEYKRGSKQLLGVGSSDDVLSSSEERTMHLHRHKQEDKKHHQHRSISDNQDSKQRRLRAAAASFYYQQRMAHWVIEQQHQGYHLEGDEEGDDFASDESDSGDNHSSQPLSDDEDHDYGELILNDESLHDEKIYSHLRGKIASPKASKNSPVHLTISSPKSGHHSFPTVNVNTDIVNNTRMGTSVSSSPRELISAPRCFSGGSIASLPSSARGSVSSVRSRTAPSQLCAVRSYRFMKENEEKSSIKSSITTKRFSAKLQVAMDSSQQPGCKAAINELGCLEEGLTGSTTIDETSTKGKKPPGFPSLTIDLSQLGTISGHPIEVIDNEDNNHQQHHPDQAQTLLDNNPNLEDIDMLLARDNASVGMREEILSDGFGDHAEQGDSYKSIQQEFQSMFFLSRPYMFFRAIELSIMFSCFFMALWVTNMISIVNDIQHADYSFIVLAEIYMILPILLHFYTLPSITETCALITAMCQLDMHVAKEVLTDTIETTRLVKAVRRKILARTAHQVMLAERMQRDVRDATQRRELDHFVHRLLHLDQDIHRLQNVHSKHSMMLKRLQRRLHHLQPRNRRRNSKSNNNSSRAAHTPTNAHDNDINTGLDLKIKTLREEIRLETKHVRHVEKKLSTAQEERGKAWHEFECLKESIDNTDLEQRRRFIDNLFEEMDQDGSGSIDRDEFREMLRHLSLTLSDHKFRLLFRTVDSVNGDGFIQREELHQFLFPPVSVMLLDDAREVGHFHREESSRREGEPRGYNNHYNDNTHTHTRYHQNQHLRCRSSNGVVGDSVDNLASLTVSQEHGSSGNKKGDRDLGIEVTVTSPKRVMSHRASLHKQHEHVPHKKGHNHHQVRHAHRQHTTHNVRNGNNSSDSSDY